MLKERHEIDTNHNHLQLKFSQMQSDESDRKEKVRKRFVKANPPIVVPFTCFSNVVHLFPLDEFIQITQQNILIRNKKDSRKCF